jgi:hypothetical protein
MLKKTSVLIYLLFSLGLLSAQNLSKPNVGSIKLRNAGAIFQNGTVKGYFNFYNLEKSDRKNNNYQLTITDENLREINSINITRPSYYLLVDGVFNGESFGFLFYDAKEKSIELIAYDKTLKETGKQIKKLTNKFGNAIYAYMAQGHEASQAFLKAVPNKGFLYYGIKDDSKSDFEIEMYDNAMKRTWVAYGPDDDYDFENANEALQDELYSGSIIMKRKNMMSMDLEVDLLVQNISDGKTLFRVPMTTSKYSVAIAEIFFEKDKQQFLIFGEYFDKNEKILKAQTLGFIAITLDMKGKIISEKTNSWSSDIKKLVDAKDKDKFDDTYILFHDFIRTADGQIFAVGEQYKKAGVPMAAMKLNIYDMVLFQFDANFAIKKVSVFEKDKNSFGLPQGLLVFSSKLLSYIAKSQGAFDFVFTQVSQDKNTFVVNYINYDREKGEKSKNVLGSIVYTPEKTLTVDKLALNRKSSDYFVYQAKEGYILISEYFAKEKRLDSRLEKINY